MARVTLVTRTGCHLCDDARAVVSAVCAEAGVAWAEEDVDATPGGRAEHGEYVPVVLVDGVRQGFWRIDPSRLRAAIAG